MITVYVVTSGNYSDYRVDAMFSTKEKAGKYIERRNEKDSYYRGHCNGVEEWQLDSLSDGWLEGKEECWTIWIGIETADVTYAEIGYDGAEEGMWVHEKEGKVAFGICADTKERAVKAAMEKRSVWLANRGA